MSELPVILAVDDDEEPLERIAAELSRRYDRDYRILCERRPDAALELLERVSAAGDEVALVLADRACTDLLGLVRDRYPRAKRGLLIPWGGWGDDETANAIREAMADGRIDYYVLEPWNSPDEFFHRTITELLTEWQRADPAVRREVTIVSAPDLPRTHEIRNLLARSGVPHTFHTADSEDGRRCLAECGREPVAGPVVIFSDGTVLDDPSNAALVRSYRVSTELAKSDYEVVVVGAGPAGLSAAVYGSSEGLDVLVVERGSIGGQAGWSSRIRNYLGFSRGVSGAELLQRAYQQAWVFDTSFLFTKEVTGLSRRDGRHVLEISDGSEILASSVVLAMGVTYRKLEIPGADAFLDKGVFYGTSPVEAQPFAGKDVVIVGGGNSAGQAAVHIARYASTVSIVCRRESLSATMSRYLRDEIEARENIVPRFRTIVVGTEGGERLEQLHLRDDEGNRATVPADALFILIGAHPHTDWLPAEIARDSAGYVKTDEALADSRALDRPARMFETSVPGVFAVGDVRSQSVKRVASAVGEGSVVIHQVHRHLESLERRAALSDAR